MVGRVWVVAEPGGSGAPAGPGSGVSSITLELVSAARVLGEAVEVIAWGDEDSVTSMALALGPYGVRRIYNVGDPAPGLPAPRVAAGMAGLIAAGAAPDLVLLGATYDGRDVAGRLSVRLDRPLLTNVVGLTLTSGGGGGGREDTGAVAEHAIFGGSQTVRSRFTGPGPGIFVIRGKSFEASTAPDEARTEVEVTKVEVPDMGRTDGARVVEHHVEASVGPNLDEASVVVSGGRGLGRAEDYSMVVELARLLGGAPGASRAIVDAGWVPYSHQVGQTGKTVRPNVYFACGISGATQHLVGMKGARHVIAINKDRDAPIFALAELGVVGDCHSVLPRLIEALRARRAEPG